MPNHVCIWVYRLVAPQVLLQRERMDNITSYPVSALHFCESSLSAAMKEMNVSKDRKVTLTLTLTPAVPYSIPLY